MLPRLFNRTFSGSTQSHCLLILIIGIIIYANTLKVPFLFDDLPCLVNNPAISNYFDNSVPVAQKHATLIPDLANSMDARRVVYFTFALNFLVHGLNVTGYHVVNLFIHLAAALSVYALMVTLFKTSYFIENPVTLSIQGWLSLLTALLFVSHPIQTSAVTYIIQRFTSLASLLYLISVVMYLKARIADEKLRQAIFLATSVSFAALGMYTKEIVFTVPVIAAVCEIMFLRGRCGRRILFLLPLICTMLIIPLNMSSQLDNVGSIKDVIHNSVNLSNLDNISQKDYFLTQLRVIVTYLRLLLLPINQHLDYDYPLYYSFFDPPVAMSALFLTGIVLSALWAYSRSMKVSPAAWQLRLFSFGTAWFFITISMSSSIIPLSDMIFEYRLYLPSTGFFIAVIAIGTIVWQKISVSNFLLIKVAQLCLLIVIAALCYATVSRNYVWGDAIRFWEDNVAKAPKKIRPHEALAMRYERDGRVDRKIEEMLTMVNISPDNPNNFKHWNDIAVNLVMLGRYSEALTAIEQAITLQPGDQRLIMTYDWVLGYVGIKKGQFEVIQDRH